MNLQDFNYTLAADPSMQAPLLVQFTIEAKGAAKPTAVLKITPGGAFQLFVDLGSIATAFKPT